MHDWSDGSFDWKSLNEAEGILYNTLKFYRVPVRDIKEKYGCYDSETEVLTKAGWKLFKDVDIQVDQFATLNSGGYLEYQQAYDYVAAPYKGIMYQISTRGVDLKVTTNHNLYIAKGDIDGGANNNGHKSFPYELQTYETLFKKRKKFLKGAKWVGSSPEHITIPGYKTEWNNVPNSNRVLEVADKFYPAIPLLKLLGWYTAEGSNNKNCELRLSLNGADGGIEQREVESILLQLEIPYTVHFRENSCSIHIYGKQFTTYFTEQCGVLAENKKVPEFIKELSPIHIKAYLEALYAGDGHKAQTSHILSTVSSRLADDVLELLLKAGNCGRISSRHRSFENVKIQGRQIKSKLREYEINWLQKNEHHSINSHDTKEQIDTKERTVDYSGLVYCVSVPNKIIYVRRNGKPVWCGNSLRCYTGLGWTSLHSIAYPGYIYSQFPDWLWKFDVNYGYNILKYTGLAYLSYKLHCWAYRRGYAKIVKKFPHIREEILCCADYDELLEGL